MTLILIILSSHLCACIFINYKGHVNERFGKSSDPWPRAQ
jgi:hypothetical protein